MCKSQNAFMLEVGWNIPNECSLGIANEAKQHQKAD